MRRFVSPPGALKTRTTGVGDLDDGSRGRHAAPRPADGAMAMVADGAMGTVTDGVIAAPPPTIIYEGTAADRVRSGAGRSDQVRVKRCVGRVLTLLSAPLMVLIAAAVAVSGPPLYVQNRVGAGAATVVTRAEGRPGRETRYVVLSVVNLALTIPLLRWFGPLGVPQSTSVAVVLSTGYFLVHFHRTTGRAMAPLLRVMRPSTMAAVAAGTAGGLAVWYLPDGAGRFDAGLAVLCRGGLVLSVAALVLAATGFLDARDQLRLRGLIRRGRQRFGTVLAEGAGR